MSEQNIEKEIDLIKLIKDLWARRKFIFKSVGVGVFVGLVVAFSIPKEYSTSAQLAPEFSNGSANKLGGLSSLAAMAGFGGAMGSGGSDAIHTALYPNVVSSLPFMCEVLETPISTVDGRINTTMYDYLDTNQKKAWWSYILDLPFEALGFVMNLFSGDESSSSDQLDISALTYDQSKKVAALRNRVGVSVDQKTMVISVSVTMQDPKVAADIANLVIEKLQYYIVEYRTKKVKKDLAYAQLVYDEAREEYYNSQRDYAIFKDKNMNISSAKYQTELDKLQNEMDIDFGLYNNLAMNLEQAKLKVQEQTPVYAVLEPVSRPSKKSAPNRPMVLIVFTFLAGAVSCAYRIFKDKLIDL